MVSAIVSVSPEVSMEGAEGEEVRKKYGSGMVDGWVEDSRVRVCRVLFGEYSDDSMQVCPQYVCRGYVRLAQMYEIICFVYV